MTRQPRRFTRVRLSTCWRLIPSLYPVRNLYARIAPPDDLEALREIERFGNERVRGETATLDQGRPQGPGSAYIAAPFAYPNPAGSRFSDGSYGVFYAAESLATAMDETRRAREKFLRATAEPPLRLGMRVLQAGVDGRMEKFRKGVTVRRSALEREKDDRRRAADIRQSGADGIVFEGRRRGRCIAVFNPKALRYARQERHLVYEWDGRRVRRVSPVKEFF